MEALLTETGQIPCATKNLRAEGYVSNSKVRLGGDVGGDAH
jgi:hypothetical protein